MSQVAAQHIYTWRFLAIKGQGKSLITCKAGSLGAAASTSSSHHWPTMALNEVRQEKSCGTRWYEYKTRQDIIIYQFDGNLAFDCLNMPQPSHVVRTLGLGLREGKSGEGNPAKLDPIWHGKADYVGNFSSW